MIHLEHSPLGGSAAHRFINCAGSFLKQREEIEAGTFEDVPSEFAELGTGAHELAAAAVGSRTEPFEYLGETFNGYRAGWEGEINLDAVQVYFNECVGIIEANAAQPGSVLLIEETIKLPEIHPLLKGTVDFAFYVPRFKLWLRDYKNGEGVGVSAPGNDQLRYYAFLLIMSDPMLRSASPDLPVSLGIVQPNFYGIYTEPDVWETTLGHILEWGYDFLIPRMTALTSRKIADAPVEADFVPGDWCQFCPVLLDCPKMQAAFQDYVAAENEYGEDFITMLTNEELDRLYAQRELARRFMLTLERTVYARKITGGNIPSAKLVEPQTARVWKPGAEAVLKARFGDKAYSPRKVLSPAGIEKLSSDGKALALEYGYKPDANRLTIAPLSDRRPEAKPRTNESVFAAHAKPAEDLGF